MNYLRQDGEDLQSYLARLITHYSSQETLEEMRLTLAKEWINRYNKKITEVGKVKAMTWWHSQADTMEAKHGLMFITELKELMNEIRKKG
jgi:hypothetical protein